MGNAALMHATLTRMVVQAPEPIVDKQGVPAYRDQVRLDSLSLADPASSTTPALAAP
jgi:hypothetical protein